MRPLSGFGFIVRHGRQVTAVAATCAVVAAGCPAVAVAAANGGHRSAAASDGGGAVPVGPPPAGSSRPPTPHAPSSGVGVPKPGQEITSLRTADSRSYATADGAVQQRIYPHPVNYRDAAGRWQPIDDTLVAQSGGGWANGAGGSLLHTPADLASGPVTVHDANGGLLIGFTLRSASNAGGIVAGASVTYRGALPSTDVTEQATPTGVKESLTLKDDSAPNQFEWSLALPNGSSLALRHGAGIVTDGHGKPAAVLSAPNVTDAAGASSTSAVSYRLLPGDGIALTVDRGWLDDPSRVFPVTVDPSTSSPPQSYSTYVYGGAPNSSYGSAGALQVGLDGGGAYRLSGPPFFGPVCLRASVQVRGLV